MKSTLLDLTQDILSAMDSDEINSINDNQEALQVARIIRNTYFDIASRANLPETFNLFSLEASGDVDKPTLMLVPTTVRSIKWLKYNKADSVNTDPNFTLINWLPLEDFLSIIDSFNLSDDNVSSFTQDVGTSTLTILYKNDKAPNYFTTLDDNTVLFDSYNSEVDTTLQKVKTSAYGKLGEDFSLTDSYIPPLDDDQFPLLFNEAKALAFAEMKQVTHAKAEKLAKKGWVNLQRSKSKFDNTHSRPNYGRK